MTNLELFVRHRIQVPHRSIHRKRSRNSGPSSIRRLLFEQCEDRKVLSAISDAAYPVLNARVGAQQESSYIYRDADWGGNIGFPSGLFVGGGADLAQIHLRTNCVDDPAATDGCTTDASKLDRLRGTVFQVAVDPLAGNQFVGLHFEEGENYGTNQIGIGRDLRGATQVLFDVRTPIANGVDFRFSLANQPSAFRHIPHSASWTTLSISFSDLGLTDADLANQHFLFTITTDAANAPNGGILLIDNIRFDPVPIAQRDDLGLPVSNETFGTLPSATATIPPDQMLRSLSTIYESSITGMVQLNRGTAEDLRDARLIADTLVYAMANDNAGLPLPQAPDGSVGLHSGYMNGEIALLNSQAAGGAQQGDVRLAGFSTSGNLCGPSHFCLVLDGATGGNVAFAMQFLLRSYQKFQDVRYLDAARSLGRWIAGNLTDTSGTGFGGYFLGYPDGGGAKIVMRGKSVENNADIFASMTLLSSIERSLGNITAANLWTTRANIAGDFVIAMFDSSLGRFYAGTVPPTQPAGPGFDPSGTQRGNDIVNRFDFIDSNSFTTLALASAPRYRNAIDWHRPVQYMIDHFDQEISVGGNIFRGFNIVSQPTPGPGRPVAGRNGVGWAFAGQAVLTMKFVDALYGETRFSSLADSYLQEIQRAQALAPFGHDGGLVAATLQDGSTLLPVDQCLSTPFQCIPERVGLEATVFAIAADLGINPLGTSLQNAAPVIASLGANLTFRENGQPLLIAANATLSDTDSMNFDSGKLAVRLSANGQSTDRLTIRNQGSAIGQISATIIVASTNTGTVSYTSSINGVLSTQQIGTFTGGIGTAPLVVTLNSNATPGTTTLLLRNVTYQNLSNNPSANPRTVSIQLTDGDGGTSVTKTKQIAVLTVNDAPVIGNFSGTTLYRANSVPLVIASASTVTDVDSTNFDTGKLTVKFSAGGQSTDRLTIRNQGLANGQISVFITNTVTNSGTVSYTSIVNGILTTQQFGVFQGGVGLTPLVINFNANATPLNVRQLLRNLTFQNVTANPPTVTRTVWAQLTDGDGGTSVAATKQIGIV